MTEFTPVASTIGGLLIGIATVMLLALNGRIAGISSIAGGLLRSGRSDRGWRIAFVLGLLGGGVLAPWIASAPFGSGSPASPAILVVAGLLVGAGTQLGSGCTSGHGLCGMSRLSRRSIVATIVFFGVAAITVYGARHVIGAVE